MIINFKEVYFLIVLINLVSATVLFFFKAFLKDPEHRLNPFIVGRILQASGLFLFAIARDIYPLIVTTLFGTTIAVLGVIIEAYAFSFFGKYSPRSNKIKYGLLFLVFLAVFIANTNNPISIRIFISTIIWVLTNFIIGYDLLNASKGKNIRKLAGIIFVLIGTLALVRSISAMFIVISEEVMFTHTTQSLSFLAYLLISLILIIAFLFLLKEEDNLNMYIQNKLINNILNGIPDLVFVTNVDKTILYSNKRVSPKPSQTITSQTCSEIFNRDFCDECKIGFLNEKNREVTFEKYDKKDNKHFKITQLLLEDELVLNICRDISDLKITQQKLHENKETLEKYFNFNPIPVAIIDVETEKYVRVNQSYLDLIGSVNSEIIGKTPSELKVSSESRLNELRSLLLRDGKIEYAKGIFRDLNGNEIEVSTFAVLIDINGKRMVYTTSMDMTELNSTREQLELSNKELIAAVQEKNVLLKEVHHRVKNNLQILQSLVLKQQTLSDNNSVKAVLQDTLNRISSIALVHHGIYASENFSEIELGKHLEQIVRKLIYVYNSPTDKVELVMDIDQIDISIEKAITCTLYTNEIVSNSLKYAFRNKQDGIITIILKKFKQDVVNLTISDNGIGISRGFLEKEFKSLGMFLIKNLAERQLKGDLKIDTEIGEGVCYRLKFTI